MSTNTSSALDQRQELQRLALPLARHTELSDAELRLAHAQLICREVCQEGKVRRRRGATPTAPRCFLDESVW